MKYSKFIEETIFPKAQKAANYLRNRPWNLEFLVAFATLLYTIHTNNEQDKDNRIETARVRLRDSTQIAVLTETFKDSKLKDQENREELKRVRFRDSVQLAIQIQKNSLESQEFLRVRKQDATELAILNNQIKAQKITNSPSLLVIFETLQDYYMSRIKKDKEKLDLKYQFQILNIGKSNMKNLATRFFIVFNTLKGAEGYVSFPMSNPAGYSSIIEPRDGSTLTLEPDKDAAIIMDRSKEIMTIERNQQTFPIVNNSFYILMEFVYDDLFEDKHKYYRILPFNFSFKDANVEPNVTHRVIMFDIPTKKPIKDLRIFRKISLDNGIDYKILEQNVLRDPNNFN